MNFPALKKALLIVGGLFILTACGGTAQIAVSEDIPLVESDQVVANVETLAILAKEFYKNHPDEYDMLVFWGSPEFGPGNSFYWPVKNDTPGLGYENVGEEFFDTSADFGSTRLQGIIWMGPNWITNTDEGSGPRSILGILAQETGHRWAATIRFWDPALGANSDALLEDAYHWNFDLNTGASPMGGNKWEPLGDSLYQALPVDYVEYSQLDMYLMGLLTAEEVDPVQLLINPRTESNLSAAKIADSGLSEKIYSRTVQPITVQADLLEIPIEQIIEAEGERNPDIGFNAKNIRQAWILVYRNFDSSVYSLLLNLENLRAEWGDFFSNATGARSTMDTEL